MSNEEFRSDSGSSVVSKRGSIARSADGCIAASMLGVDDMPLSAFATVAKRQHEWYCSGAGCCPPTGPRLHQHQARATGAAKLVATADSSQQAPHSNTEPVYVATYSDALYEHQHCAIVGSISSLATLNVPSSAVDCTGGQVSSTCDNRGGWEHRAALARGGCLLPSRHPCRNYIRLLGNNSKLKAQGPWHIRRVLHHQELQDCRCPQPCPCSSVFIPSALEEDRPEQARLRSTQPSLHAGTWVATGTRRTSKCPPVR